MVILDLTKLTKMNTHLLNIIKGNFSASTKSTLTTSISLQMAPKMVIELDVISTRKDKERIQTKTYFVTFNQPRTPKEVKISHFLERVEQYVLAPLRYFKFQKHGHSREACRGLHTCAKCSRKDPDHVEED